METQKKIVKISVFDFDEKNADNIVKSISDKLRPKYPKYNYSIIIDTDLSD